MAGFNRVIMLGNLTFDPELRHLDNGTAAATLGLAVNRRYSTQAGEQREEVCFIDVNVYGRLAEVCCQYLATGRQVLVEGRLTFQQWETETGEKRSKHRILAQTIQFLGSPAGSDESSDAKESEGARARSTSDWTSGGHSFKVKGDETAASEDAEADPPDDIPF